MILIIEIRKMKGDEKLSSWIPYSKSMEDHRKLEEVRKKIAKEFNAPNVDLRYETIDSTHE